MAITPNERERRRNFVGSSDAAAIANADPYRNFADVLLDKTGQLEEWEGNEATRNGERLERLALDWFEERMGMPLVRRYPGRETKEDGIWLDDGDCFCANLDSATLLDGETWTGCREELSSPVDAKSTIYIDLWGDNASDIPAPKIIQVQWQMKLIGPQSRRGYLPIIFPKYRDLGFVTPPMVKRDDEMIAELEMAAREFMGWVRRINDATGTEAKQRLQAECLRDMETTPHLESLKRVRREPDSVLSLDMEQSAEIEAYWNAGMFCDGCGWFGHEAQAGRHTNSDGDDCGHACKPRSRQHYKDKEVGAKTDAEHFHAKVVAMLGASETARLIDGAMFTYSSVKSARQTDEDLLQHKLATLQDCIVRAAEQIKSGVPGDALSILNSVNAEAIYDQVVSQGSHRRLFYKKPKIKGKRR